MGGFLKVIFVLLIIVFIGIQFVEAERTNPAVTAEIQAPNEIKSILCNSCYDCHSNLTEWPLYSRIAPVSWFIINDVDSGREHLNFSDWGKYTDALKEKKLKEIWEQINEDRMPPKAYRFLHPGSEIELNEKNTIKKWITGKGIWDLR